MQHTAHLSQEMPDGRQYEVAVKRLATALSYGQEKSPFLGAGIEYVQSRPYLPGDPVKLIDWRVTARTGRVHVKEYEAPRQMPVYLLIDTSASMCISSQRLSKYAWAVQVAGGLALAALDHMNPVGVLSVGERELHHTPTLSRNSIMQWMHQLRRYRPVEGTTLGRRIRELVPRVEQRCLFVVLSDLHDLDGIPAIKLMAQDHDCVVLHFEDPAERGRTGGGIYRGLEAETGREFVAHGRTKWFDAVESHALARAGVDYLHLPIEQPLLPRLRQFFKHRGGTRRMSA
jgi:uncharacterized protein (DUF58 family)